MTGKGAPLAWRNLTANKRRLATSLAGTAFAVTLMFIQNAFRESLVDSMSAVIARLDGQLFLMNRAQYVVTVPQPFPRARLLQARAVELVREAIPVFIESQQIRWRHPQTGVQRRIRVIAYPLETHVLKAPGLSALTEELRRPGVAAGDEQSKQDYYGDFTDNAASELGGRRVQIVGTFSLGRDYQNSGSLVMSERNFLRLFPQRKGTDASGDAVDVGVLRVADGVDLQTAKRKVQSVLPEDALVLTKAEYAEKEKNFWRKVTPVGAVFDIGLIMGFVVGLAICYQVLYSDVSDHMAEFATLKAVGYSNRALSGIIVAEALYLSVLGFAAGVVVSLGLFYWIQNATGLPVKMTGPDLAMILVATVAMCVTSGWLASRKLTRIDPAELFG